MKKTLERKKIFTGSFFLKLVTRLLLVICCIMVAYPLLWYLYSSVKSSNEFMSDAWALPKALHFENYVDAINNSQLYDYEGNPVGILKLLANTLFTSLLGTGLLVVMSATTAFILCKYSFKGKNFFKAFFLMAMVIPSILLIVPLYTQLTSISKVFKNNLIVVAFIYALQGLPVQVFLLTRFINNIDDALLEAARLDGASEFKLFFKVILPSIKPILVFIALTSFMGNFNEYTIALLFLNNPSTYTLSIGLEAMKIGAEVNNHYGTVFAGFTISTVLMVVLYCVFQKQILKGIDMSEGVKG